jgi:voltage-gated potassium channel
MEFTLKFLLNFGQLVGGGLPLFFGLGLIISSLSVWVGRKEGWTTSDSLYFGFITALTVGYGDLRPTTGRGKVSAIVIAFLGLISTGIVVAIAVEAASLTYAQLVGPAV